MKLLIKCLQVETATLDSQLKGKLPFKIGNITISGKKLKSIASNAFKVTTKQNIVQKQSYQLLRRFVLPIKPTTKDFQGKALTLTLQDNGVTELTKALFQNLGNVRWLQLELRHNKLSTVAEPSTTIHPGTSGSVFLTQLQLADNPWNCDCSIG